MTTIQISLHNRGNNLLIGTIVIDQDMSEREVGEIANESGGMSNLVGMSSDSTVQDDYEWTGDEVYEIVQG